jgi:hypothetical protein
MKPAPALRVPRLFTSDFNEARQIIGHEPKYPVGVVLSPHAYAELRAYGCRFPCPVAVDPTAPRETVAWYWLKENFDPFAELIQ